uniref:DUS-like FMN-binding domain-containing protein n=1 Tax=Chromera velia CCMP2878 TaxID=1169474 RepID=A0A0G4F6M8_9ALVE|eukprot:Cvel_15472.t1-p1 / transcript=Cvel_15472.t1 / gene=Cvel_15472 / organism=Chromera_velia_CCMP2878 / gene_product=tRNA-dihydrouridine(20) synthase [NAD(P) ]-like, putative / transcript_product=tRNA-dihydrouridine(20) synthase [NAD(P) ]-like, putative / location=Cvel_scaffold1147:4367-7639(+) / protein_length=515 / sequence_SO=supercontig / SO=protein_coding / is_pseudo=false
MDYHHEALDYRNKYILAPMVRIGVLPFRLECLKYGADLVYSEEIIDRRISETVRRENSDFPGLIEYIHVKDKALTWSTCEAEKGKVVLQLGTASAVGALKAAMTVARDVAAIDINMGCPKGFSTNAGMGAALLKTPEISSDILKTLRRNLPCPVTCKIRLLEPDLPFEKTRDYLRMCEQSGAVAIGVHARLKEDRPRVRARWPVWALLKDSISVPLIANGDFFSSSDVGAFLSCHAGSVDSIMVARGAMWDPSVFWKMKRDHPLTPGGGPPVGPVRTEPSRTDVWGDVVRRCVECNNPFQATKFTMQKMTEEAGMTQEFKERLTQTRNTEDICDIFEVGDWYRGARREQTVPFPPHAHTLNYYKKLQDDWPGLVRRQMEEREALLEETEKGREENPARGDDVREGGQKRRGGFTDEEEKKEADSLFAAQKTAECSSMKDVCPHQGEAPNPVPVASSSSSGSFSSTGSDSSPPVVRKRPKINSSQEEDQGDGEAGKQVAQFTEDGMEDEKAEGKAR